jgi:hypothetical protein
MGVVAFAVVVLVLARDASAADDARTLAHCDGAAAVPFGVNVALLIVTFPISPEGRTTKTFDSVIAAVPYTLGSSGAIFAVCAPAVHAANERPLAALGSFAARLGGPFAGVVATYESYQAFGFSWTSLFVTLTAVPTGIGLAMLTDYFYFTPPDGTPTSHPRTSSWRLTPAFAPTHGGAAGALAVAF